MPRHDAGYRAYILDQLKAGASIYSLARLTGITQQTLRTWKRELENGAKPVEYPAEKLPEIEPVKEEEKPVPFLDVQILHRLDRIANTLEELLKVWKE